MKKATIGIVETRAQAEFVVAGLQESGFQPDEISALFPNASATQGFAHEKHTKAPEGAAVGAAGGGLLGGTLGVLAGIGALAIPGLGPFIAAGPILAGLSGAAAGAAVGGVAGTLAGMGIPEVEAKLYEDRLRAGHILIAVHTEDSDMRDRAVRVFKQVGVKDTSTIAEKEGPSTSRR